MQNKLAPLSFAFMNEDHAHALDQLVALAVAIQAFPDRQNELKTGFLAFLSHNRDHFMREAEAMRASG